MERKNEVKVLSNKKLKDLLEPYVGKNEHKSLRISNGCTIMDTAGGVVMEAAYGMGYVDLDIERFLSNIYSTFAFNPFVIGLNLYPDNDTWGVIVGSKFIKTKTPIEAIPIYFDSYADVNIYADDNGVNFNKGESKLVLKTYEGIEQVAISLDDDGTMGIYVKDSKGSRYINSKGESGDVLYVASEQFISIIDVVNGVPIIKDVKSSFCRYPNMLGVSQHDLIDIGDKKYKVVSINYKCCILIEIDEQVRMKYLLNGHEFTGVMCLYIINTTTKDGYYTLIDTATGFTTILKNEEEIELAVKLIRSIEFTYDGMITVYSNGKLKKAKPFASGYLLEDNSLVNRNGKVLLEDVKDADESYTSIPVRIFYANDKIHILKGDTLHSYPKDEFGKIKDTRFISNTLSIVEGSNGVNAYIGDDKVIFSDKVSHTSNDGALLDKDYKLIDRI